MRQILAITLIVFSFTACSLWSKFDSKLVTTDSYSTPTRTATVTPPLVLGLNFEPTTAPSLYPTATPQPFIDTLVDSELLPWFQVPDSVWFPLIVP